MVIEEEGIGFIQTKDIKFWKPDKVFFVFCNNKPLLSRDISLETGNIDFWTNIGLKFTNS